MNWTFTTAMSGLLLAGIFVQTDVAGANSLASRAPSKSELIKRCMQKSMTERRDLHYNEAAKDCAKQIELQSNTSGPTAVAKPAAAAES